LEAKEKEAENEGSRPNGACGRTAVWPARGEAVHARERRRLAEAGAESQTMASANALHTGTAGASGSEQRGGRLIEYCI
jgi:hypothetical protein